MHLSGRAPAGKFGREVRGFTLVEFVVAAGVISIFIAGSVVAMTQLNRFATASRLQTLAQALAQQRIDEILTIRPWNRTFRPPALHPVTGTRTERDLPLNNDLLNDVDVAGQFTPLDVEVRAVRSTVITEIPAPPPVPPAVAQPSRQVRADVTVTYTYRNRDYTIRMTTVRTQDSI